VSLATLDQETQILASFLPPGRAWGAKHIEGSVLRSLLKGFAWSMLRVHNLVHRFRDQIIPDNTTDFIAEWEAVLGIPDACFSTNPESLSLATRRKNVLTKIAALGIQTEADFVALALVFGKTVTVKSGIEHDNVVGYGTALPVVLFASAQDARMTIVVTVADYSATRFDDYQFSFQFGDDDAAIMECLFQHLKPANCDLKVVAP
jgi:uncharacterized protein YmfQ (DUF2313 family)